MPNPIFTYLGHDIHLTENFFFHVTGPEFDSIDIFFESRRSAMREINNRVLQSRLRQLRAPHDKHEVLDTLGETGYAFRINPASAKIAGFESHSAIYPNIPWIRDLLFDRKELQRQINVIDLMLEKVAISVARSATPGFDLAWLNIKLETELREKRAYAINHNLEP